MTILPCPVYNSFRACIFLILLLPYENIFVLTISAFLKNFLKKVKVKEFLDGLYGGSITNAVVNSLKKYWEVLKDPQKLKETFKELYDDFMDWMQSLDPVGTNLLGWRAYS